MNILKNDCDVNSHMTTMQVKKEESASTPGNQDSSLSSHTVLPPHREDKASESLKLISLLSVFYCLSMHPYTHSYSCTH